jgi:ActR/RegA family two-component response regulator
MPRQNRPDAEYSDVHSGIIDLLKTSQALSALSINALVKRDGGSLREAAASLNIEADIVAAGSLAEIAAQITRAKPGTVDVATPMGNCDSVLQATTRSSSRFPVARRRKPHPLQVVSWKRRDVRATRRTSWHVWKQHHVVLFAL